MNIAPNFTTNETFSCGKWNWTEDETKTEVIHGWWVHGAASISIGLLGIIVNVIMIIVLSTKDFWKIFFNKLVICLTVSDIIYLGFSVYESFRLHILNMNYCSYQGYIQLIVYPMRKISMCFSVYMTIILSFERYRAVTNPIQHRNRVIGASSKKRFIKYISPAFVVSFVIYGIPSFFAFKMKLYQLPSINEMSAPSIFDPQETIYCLDIWWRLERIYVLWYSNVTNFIITNAIPATLLIIFNTKMYLAIRHSYKNKVHLGRRRYSNFGAKLAEEIQQALE